MYDVSFFQLQEKETLSTGKNLNTLSLTQSAITMGDSRSSIPAITTSSARSTTSMTLNPLKYQILDKSIHYTDILSEAESKNY